MNFFQMLFMAILQGIAALLPISSTGHVVLLEHLLKINAETGILLTVTLYIGTLLVVLVAFGSDVVHLSIELWRILKDILYNVKTLFHNKSQSDAKRYQKILSNNYRKFAAMIIVSIIPTAVIGMCLRGMVNKTQGSLLATGAGMLITAVFLLVANFIKQGQKRPLDMDYKIALLIGIVQGFAVLPGISRTGITIAICLLCGFTCKFAIKYSFVLAIPTLIGTNMVMFTTLPKEGISGLEILYCIVGAIIVVVVGFQCAGVALGVIRKKWLKYFAGYSLIMGIVAIVYHFI